MPSDILWSLHEQLADSDLQLVLIIVAYTLWVSGHRCGRAVRHTTLDAVSQLNGKLSSRSSNYALNVHTYGSLYDSHGLFFGLEIAKQIFETRAFASRLRIDKGGTANDTPTLGSWVSQRLIRSVVHQCQIALPS